MRLPLPFPQAMNYMFNVNVTKEANWPYTGTNGTCDFAKIAATQLGQVAKSSAASTRVGEGVVGVGVGVEVCILKQAFP